MNSFHSIEDILRVVDVMSDKTDALRKLIKAGNIGREEIEYYMDDIKAHAGQIYNAVNQKMVNDPNSPVVKWKATP